jgi:hypothetical protein
MISRAIDAYRTWTDSSREDSRRLVREAVRPRAIAAEVESSELCRPIRSVALSMLVNVTQIDISISDRRET